MEASPTSYPFQKPIALLKSGAELFPDGSIISNGDYVEIDCDWTPSFTAPAMSDEEQKKLKHEAFQCRRKASGIIVVAWYGGRDAEL